MFDLIQYKQNGYLHSSKLYNMACCPQHWQWCFQLGCNIPNIGHESNYISFYILLINELPVANLHPTVKGQRYVGHRKCRRLCALSILVTFYRVDRDGFVVMLLCMHEWKLLALNLIYN